MASFHDAEQLFLKKLSLDRVFAFISRTDYFLLTQIQDASSNSERDNGIYLSELAEYWKIPIADVSRIAKRLEEKGWIIWTFDENKTHTWLCLSDAALEKMEKQKHAMLAAFGRITSSIQEEDLQTTIRTVHTIQELIESQEIFM